MRFKKLTRTLMVTRKSDVRMNGAAGTTIQTKKFGVWITDGYDDKVPMI